MKTGYNIALKFSRGLDGVHNEQLNFKMKAELLASDENRCVIVEISNDSPKGSTGSFHTEQN